MASVHTDAYIVTIVTHADRLVQSSDVWTQQIQSDHLQMTALTVCIKNQIQINQTSGLICSWRAAKRA